MNLHAILSPNHIELPFCYKNSHLLVKIVKIINKQKVKDENTLSLELNLH
jgi:hypothetical protein